MLNSFVSQRQRFFLHFEWLILTIGLLVIALHNPYNDSASLCIIDRMGFTFCPGCGLGKSIALLFRGQLYASFEAHLLGIPAVLILIYRIIFIFRRNFTIKKLNQL